MIEASPLYSIGAEAVLGMDELVMYDGISAY
jgi:hypothetical protein